MKRPARGKWLAPRPRRAWLLACCLLFLLPALLLPARDVLAATPPKGNGELPIVSVLWREGCPHCIREKEFLAGLQRERPGLQVHLYDVAQPEGRRLFETLTSRYGLPRVTPITLIGRRVLVGFSGEETTGADIHRLLATEPSGLSLPRVLSEPAPQGAACPATGPCEAARPDGLGYVEVPFLGRQEAAGLALPLLATLMGFIDGFNPCAMWVLVAFLAALLQAGSLRRMVQFAGIFILAEGLMYLAILNSWAWAFDFVRADRIVTPLIGVLAIAGGLFFLYEWSTFSGACPVAGPERRARTLSRLDALSRGRLTPLAVLGILGLAFSVNVVEFACSLGVPQAFTKVLDLNRVGLLERQGLMGLYILFYMLDDLAVFGLAIWGAGRLGLTERYARATNLVGGLFMVGLGALLLAVPGALRF